MVVAKTARFVAKTGRIFSSKGFILKKMMRWQRSFRSAFKPAVGLAVAGGAVLSILSGVPGSRAGQTPNAPSDGPWRTFHKSNYWAFQPITKPPLPEVGNKNWLRSPVDAFILAKLEAKAMSPTPTADKRTLIRRASYDLTGLPPTPEEIDAFVADLNPDAFAKVVERLLASLAYGERWGRHWLDVVRYADARDLIQLPAASDFREAWRYRDWVVEAHNRDLPYRDFIRLQIAGDLLQPSDPTKLDEGALVATGFLAIADFVPGDVDKDLMIADYVNDQIDVMGRAFLGLTLACARCHDHKFDPISMEDYYALAGIFFSTRLIPSPVPGNTPLVRVPLLPKAELERITAAKKRVAYLEKELQQIKPELDLEYLTQLERLVAQQTAKYLVAVAEFKNCSVGEGEPPLAEFAKSRGVSGRILERWLDYFGLREYPRCRSLSRDDGGVRGLYRWSNGKEMSAVRVNVRDEPVELKRIKFPPRSVACNASKASGAGVAWRSPFAGRVRITGRVTDASPGSSKGFLATLDLGTSGGRRELTDLPIAGLLRDLKSRGLLQDTLVIWGGEFGRTPAAQGPDGRDHHPFGFTMWLAGGGVRGGMTYGATDEFGWDAVENPVHVHDLHATILHLLGLDHEKLTYRYAGRDFRLTDVYGRVVKEIIT